MNRLCKLLSVVNLIVLTSFGVSGQGIITFNNHVPGVIVTHVYGPDPDISRLIRGNGSDDTPAGTTIYNGQPLAGSGYSAQLWGSPGANFPFAPFVDPNNPSQPLTVNFRTGAASGFVSPPLFNPILVGSLPGAIVTVKMRAWDNLGGTITSVLYSFSNGESLPFVVTLGGVNPQGQTFPTPDLIGLQSFNISPASVPEPSAMVLLIVGAAAIFRRRK